MQFPNISYYLSTGCSYLSAGYSHYSAFRQRETEIYTSIFNTALKYAGVKEPFFTPFRTNLLVTPISLAVGAIIGYLLFFKAPKPECSTSEKKATPPTQKADPVKSEPSTLQKKARPPEPTQLPKPVNTPTNKDEPKSPTPSSEENVAISDDELLPLEDFLYLIADANDSSDEESQGKLEVILLTKDLSYINGDDSAISFALMMEVPIQFIDNLPEFGVEVNELYATGTVLSLLVGLYACDKDQLTRIEELLKIGADPTIKNPEGKSALDLAPIGGDLRKILEKAVAKLYPEKK